MGAGNSPTGRIALIGNYLPRQCGIATFTTHLCEAIVAQHGTDACFAIPVNDRPTGYAYPDRVRFELSERDLTSSDLVHWGDSHVLITPAPYHWDEMKIGPGAPPLLTDRGWLVIYHGAFETMAGAVYRLGVALLEKENPTRVLGVADDWILQPEDPWEVTGYVPNVVFSCGAIPEADGSVRIYWGGADSVMCVDSARIDELVERCIHNGRASISALMQ